MCDTAIIVLDYCTSFSPRDVHLTSCRDLCSSRSESYWTAVVGEFDITKTDPDEQVLKVNRIIPHPKVTSQSVTSKRTHRSSGSDSVN